MNWRAFLAGAAVALVAAWPVGEGLWALTWQPVADGYSPDMAAAQRLLARHPAVIDERSARGVEGIIATDDCLERLLAHGPSASSDA